MDNTKYPSIRFVDTDHLFWSHYPYKVVISFGREHSYNKIRETHYHSLPLSSAAVDWRERWTQFANKRATERAYRKDFIENLKNLPADGSYTIYDRDASVSIFFVNAADVAVFIDGNHALIFEVHRPGSDKQLDEMRLDANVLVRKNLWFYTYRYCLTFERCHDAAEEKLAQSMQEYFGDFERGYFSWSNGNCKLYLRDEADAVLAKLASNVKVTKVEQIKLQNEIDSKKNIDECDVGAGFDCA